MHVIKINNSPYDGNSYLVDGCTLIDAGMDSSYIVSEIKKHISPENLETIILTHCHYDHTSGAKGVAEVTGAKIAIHRNDAALLGNPVANASGLFGRKAPEIKPDILLSGGEIFQGLKIIHTPGHTPGGICLYDDKSRNLFSGDTVFQDGRFGRTDLFGGNAHQLVESIRKLSLLDVSIMYPGHGDIVLDNANEQIKLSLMMAAQYSNL